MTIGGEAGRQPKSLVDTIKKYASTIPYSTKWRNTSAAATEPAASRQERACSEIGMLCEVERRWRRLFGIYLFSWIEGYLVIRKGESNVNVFGEKLAK